jgi:CRP-like cAMP-binding protein
LPAKAVQYRANSIIYFKGDASERIYILNRGRVSLNYIDIETSQEVHDLIKTGEFFGVKSSMGRYPREETALALEDAVVFAFTVSEFEEMAAKNTRIVMAMLRVFSNQLRRIHKQVQNLLYMEDQVNSETGLFKIGEYYLKTRNYTQAIYALSRHLVYYPSGKYASAVARHIELAEEYLGKYGQGEGPVVELPGQSTELQKPSRTRELSESARKYYNAVSLVSKEQYKEALGEFETLGKEGVEREYQSKSRFEVGRCLFYLKQYDKCIRVFTELVQKYPKHPDFKEALYFIAKSYEEIGENQKSMGLYKKLLSITKESDPLRRKVATAIRTLEGARR